MQQGSHPLQRLGTRYGTGSQVLAILLIASLFVTACKGIESPPPGDDSLAHLSGRIIIDGSSTVYPIAQAIAEEFGYLAGNVQNDSPTHAALMLYKAKALRTLGLATTTQPVGP